MNSSRTLRKRGFTIIELLIVVAIILVLATAGLGVAFFMIKRAKMMNALAVCTELQQGVENYHTDHNRMPLELSGDATIHSDSPEGLQLLRVLLDRETAGDKFNTEGRVYINIKEGRKGIDGLIYADSGSLEKLIDPWGGPYKIRLDDGIDKRVEVKPKGSSKIRDINGRVAVWTDGADGVDGTGDSKDDVKTW